MVIHSGIITLDYSPSGDILVTSLPDIQQFGMSEVSYCLDLITDSVRSYDIKHLLLDSSRSLVEVEDAAYRALTRKFALYLIGTRLRKIARVGTEDAAREEESARLSKDLLAELNLRLLFRNFATRGEAMEWLKG